MVRASRATVSPQVQHSDLPEALTKRLRDLLAYDVFEMQAQAQLAGTEGQIGDLRAGAGVQGELPLRHPDGRPAGQAARASGSPAAPRGGRRRTCCRPT